MVKDLVTIVTPCYNTASYLGKLLQSVVEQTYDKIEMIVIDDGSPDDIKGVVDKFKNKFEERGFDLRYLRQENSGQSVALQRGIDEAKGEYFVWPDSDDYYASAEAISKMVNRLLEFGDDYGMVRTQETLVRDDERNTPIEIWGLNAKERETSELFSDCIFHRNGFYFAAGACMIRRNPLLLSTGLPIYTHKAAGQNWQILLPVLYNYKCTTILEQLYSVVKRAGSHSRKKFNFEDSIEKQEIYESTLLNTIPKIKNMSEKQQEYYLKLVETHYLEIKFNIAIGFNNSKKLTEYYKKIKSLGKLSPRIRLRYFMYRLGIYSLMFGLKDTIRRIH